MIITNSHYALVGYYITSYPTRAHGIIVIYSLVLDIGQELICNEGLCAGISLKRDKSNLHFKDSPH